MRDSNLCVIPNYEYIPLFPMQHSKLIVGTLNPKPSTGWLKGLGGDL